MSFEVAAVHATIGFRTQGEAQAAQAADRVSQSLARLADVQNTIERAAQSSNIQIQAQGAKLQQMAVALDRARQAHTQALAAAQAQGRTAENVAQSINTLTAAILNDQAHVEKLAAEYAHLEEAMRSAAAAGKPLQAKDFQRFTAIQPEITEVLERLAANKTRLNTEFGLEELFGGLSVLRAEADVSKLNQATKKMLDTTDKVPGVMQAAARSSRANQTAITGLFSALRTGRIGTSLMAQGALGLASALGGPLAIALGVATVALIGFVTKMISAADAARQANPRFLEMAQSLDSVSNAAEAAASLELISNRLQGQGAPGPVALTKGLADLAEQLQYLRPGANDAAVTLDALSNAIIGVTSAGLDQFGVNVSALNQELQRLAEQGLGQAAQRAAILDAVQERVSRSATRIADQAEREALSLGQVGDKLKEMLNGFAASEQAQALVAELAEALRDLLTAVEPLLPAIGIFAAVLGKSLVFSIRVVTAAIIGMVKYWELLLRALDVVIPGEAFGGMADKLNDISAEMVRQVRTSTEVDNQWKRMSASAVQFGEDAESAFQQGASAAEMFRQSVSQGFGVVDSIRGVAEAFREMDEGITPTNALQTIQAIDQAFGSLLQGGQESLDRMRDQILTFFQAGFIDRETFEALSTSLGHIQEVARPMLEEVGRFEGILGESQSAAQTAAVTNNQSLVPSVYNVSDGFITAAGSVDLFISRLGAIPSSISVGVGVVPGVVARHRAGVAERQQAGAGSLPSSIARGEGAVRGDNTLRRNFDDFKKGIDAVIGDLPPVRGGGGGGGGGGGRLASIEDIRNLFRELNRAILIGLRGGVLFSTAGNTIPAGGPAEFLNTKGGTLIQTVNIRGIWDFADPAAKRQIIKELEEAIRNLKRET
jgi:hypothetical protein